MQKVYVVMRNADFTEGRGPMLMHSLWLRGPEAVKFVESQDGIYGSPQRVEMGKYGHYASANGFQIDEKQIFVTLSEYEATADEAVRAAALAKLSPKEKAVLGLKD